MRLARGNVRVVLPCQNKSKGVVYNTIALVLDDFELLPEMAKKNHDTTMELTAKELTAEEIAAKAAKDAETAAAQAKFRAEQAARSANDAAALQVTVQNMRQQNAETLQLPNGSATEETVEGNKLPDENANEDIVLNNQEVGTLEGDFSEADINVALNFDF